MFKFSFLTISDIWFNDSYWFIAYKLYPSYLVLVNSVLAEIITVIKYKLMEKQSKISKENERKKQIAKEKAKEMQLQNVDYKPEGNVVKVKKSRNVQNKIEKKNVSNDKGMELNQVYLISYCILIINLIMTAIFAWSIF